MNDILCMPMNDILLQMNDRKTYEELFTMHEE